MLVIMKHHSLPPEKTVGTTRDLLKENGIKVSYLSYRHRYS